MRHPIENICHALDKNAFCIVKLIAFRFSFIFEKINKNL